MKMKRLLALGALLLAPAAPALAAPAVPAPGARAEHGQAQFERLWLGSAWYPEQWPESAWEADLALMKAHGGNVVRIGEFAWSRMEPREGDYDMGWLVRATRLAAKYGIRVVIGTPTDTPPAWLTGKY